MPYIAFLDDNLRECPTARLDLCNVYFKMSPPATPGDDYTIINISMITSETFTRASTARYLGVYQEVDDKTPFYITVLDNVRELRANDQLGIHPGALKIGGRLVKREYAEVPQHGSEL